METAKIPQPGAIVLGPFYSDGRPGVGIIRPVGRELWTRVGNGYVPVEIIAGDRARGGYRPETLTETVYKAVRS